MRINKGFRAFESTSSEDESNKGPPKALRDAKNPLPHFQSSPQWSIPA
uniref:Uncharacterized protein n=1 Tax=Vitis vinifera TaxID=29760 RepID=F6HCP4_VITVI